MFASMRKVSIPTDDVDITSLVYPERISPSIRSRFLLFDAAAIVEWNSELVAIQTADARDRIALCGLGLGRRPITFAQRCHGSHEPVVRIAQARELVVGNPTGGELGS